MTRSEASTARDTSVGGTAETVPGPHPPAAVPGGEPAPPGEPEPWGEPARRGGRARRDDAPIVLERYRLTRQLGAGAFGTVWRARDERLERDVAVKIVPRDRIVGGRFEREARAAARLAHPGIVTLYEAGADDDGAYLVSELVRGSTLGVLLEAGRLSDREIAAIGVALCDALAHAHAENVVHRDVKPSNVLVPDHPSTPASVAKLTDFGVARIVGGDTLTKTGDVVGTAAYMAPEQAEGREVGAAADLYALALVLYEALTGVNPVRTGTAAQRARRLGAHLPPLRRQRRDLPRELAQAIDLALRPRPRERGGVQDLRDSLAAVASRLSDSPGVVAPAWRPSRPDRPDRLTREDRDDRDPTSRAGPPHVLDHDYHDDPSHEDDQHHLSAHAPARWPERALAGLAAAGLAAWLVANLLPSLHVAPLAAALVAAILVAAVPRIGWFACVLILTVWLSFVGRTGAAVVVALGGLLPALLAPWRGTVWSLPAAAPALGAVGLAGAWPALAGRARGAPTRAALGAVGWTWTALGTAFSGTDLYLRAPPGTPPPGQWPASMGATVQHVLAPLASTGALAPAVVWAGAAVVLPWLVRGRSIAVDFVLASAWAAGLVAATYTSLRAVHSSLAGTGIRGAVLGGVGAFIIALAPAVLRRTRARRATARVP